jgi:hypothetical protein
MSYKNRKALEAFEKMVLYFGDKSEAKSFFERNSINNLEAMIIANEGFTPTAYSDNTQTSIGFGTATDNPNREISPDEAVLEMRNHLNTYVYPHIDGLRERAISNGVDLDSMIDTKFLADYYYNVGTNGTPAADEALVRGDIETAKQEYAQLVNPTDRLMSNIQLMDKSFMESVNIPEQDLPMQEQDVAQAILNPPGLLIEPGFQPENQRPPDIKNIIPGLIAGVAYGKNTDEVLDEMGTNPQDIFTSLGIGAGKTGKFLIENALGLKGISALNAISKAAPIAKGVKPILKGIQAAGAVGGSSLGTNLAGQNIAEALSGLEDKDIAVPAGIEALIGGGTAGLITAATAPFATGAAQSGSAKSVADDLEQGVQKLGDELVVQGEAARKEAINGIKELAKKRAGELDVVNKKISTSAKNLEKQKVSVDDDMVDTYVELVTMRNKTPEVTEAVEIIEKNFSQEMKSVIEDVKPDVFKVKITGTKTPEAAGKNALYDNYDRIEKFYDKYPKLRNSKVIDGLNDPSKTVDYDVNIESSSIPFAGKSEKEVIEEALAIGIPEKDLKEIMSLQANIEDVKRGYAKTITEKWNEIRPYSKDSATGKKIFTDFRADELYMVDDALDTAINKSKIPLGTINKGKVLQAKRTIRSKLPKEFVTLLNEKGDILNKYGDPSNETFRGINKVYDSFDGKNFKLNDKTDLDEDTVVTIFNGIRDTDDAASLQTHIGKLVDPKVGSYLHQAEVIGKHSGQAQGRVVGGIGDAEVGKSLIDEPELYKTVRGRQVDIENTTENPLAFLFRDEPSIKTFEGTPSTNPVAVSNYYFKPETVKKLNKLTGGKGDIATTNQMNKLFNFGNRVSTISKDAGRAVRSQDIVSAGDFSGSLQGDFGTANSAESLINQAIFANTMRNMIRPAASVSARSVPGMLGISSPTANPISFFTQSQQRLAGDR